MDLDDRRRSRGGHPWVVRRQRARAIRECAEKDNEDSNERCDLHPRGFAGRSAEADPSAVRDSEPTAVCDTNEPANGETDAGSNDFCARTALSDAASPANARATANASRRAAL